MRAIFILTCIFAVSFAHAKLDNESTEMRAILLTQEKFWSKNKYWSGPEFGERIIFIGKRLFEAAAELNRKERRQMECDLELAATFRAKLDLLLAWNEDAGLDARDFLDYLFPYASQLHDLADHPASDDETFH